MKVFRVEGLYSPKGKTWHRFSKDVVAEDEDAALERAYSLLGSKYGIKRRLIDIKKVSEIKPEESNDPTVKYATRDSDE